MKTLNRHPFLHSLRKIPIRKRVAAMRIDTLAPRTGAVTTEDDTELAVVVYAELVEDDDGITTPTKTKAKRCGMRLTCTLGVSWWVNYDYLA
jgi:hypothetical protein